MNHKAYLPLLAALGSALVWWPAFMSPSLDLPLWSLFAILALIAALSAALWARYWFVSTAAAAIGSCAGLWSGYRLFPSDDPIADSYAPIVLPIAAFAATVAALLGGVAGRFFPRANVSRKVLVFAFSCCVAWGPVALALTPLLVTRRIERNDRVVAERFASLKEAVERTWRESGGPGHICDAHELRKRYAGPPFSQQNWLRITSGAVKQDGYLFMVHCRERGGYLISSSPDRRHGDGSRTFCTDETGREGCRWEWTHSRNVCRACPQ